MSEDQLQASQITWFRNTYRDLARLIWAVPNGGKRNAIEAAKMQATGTTPGVWDIHFFYQKQLYIFENKVGNNQLTEDKRVGNRIIWGQREWGNIMAKHGAIRYICYTLPEFQASIISIIGY